MTTLADDLLAATETALEATRLMARFAGLLSVLHTQAETQQMTARATPVPLRDIEDIVAEVAGWPTAEETGAPLMEPGPLDDFILAARSVRQWECERKRRAAVKLVINNNEGKAS